MMVYIIPSLEMSKWMPKIMFTAVFPCQLSLYQYSKLKTMNSVTKAKSTLKKVQNMSCTDYMTASFWCKGEEASW